MATRDALQIHLRGQVRRARERAVDDEVVLDAIMGLVDDYAPPPVAGVDASSGVMRVEWRLLGGHVHCRVFGPFSGKAGDLVFREDEWDHFRRTNRGWQFTEVPA